MIDLASLVWCPRCGREARIADTIGDRLLLVRCEDEDCGWSAVEELEPEPEAA